MVFHCYMIILICIITQLSFKGRFANWDLQAYSWHSQSSVWKKKVKKHFLLLCGGDIIPLVHSMRHARFGTTWPWVIECRIESSIWCTCTLVIGYGSEPSLKNYWIDLRVTQILYPGVDSSVILGSAKTKNEKKRKREQEMGFTRGK